MNPAREQTATRKALSAWVVWRFFMIVGVAAGMSGTAHAQEQTEPCEGDPSEYPLGKGFLKDFGIKTDGYDNAPVDVQCFVEYAALCQHFAGEEGYNAEREKEIVKALKDTCPAAQRMHKALKAKYKDNAAVRQILAVCEKGDRNKSPYRFGAVCADFDAKDIIE